MASSVFRLLTAFFAGGALAAGGYAWYLRVHSEQRIGAATADARSCHESLDTCTKARAAEGDARLKAAEALDASMAELGELRAQHEEAEKRMAALNSLTEKFRKMIDSGKLQVILRHGRMVVKLPASILFASGSADLSKEGKDALHEVAMVLKQVPDRTLMVAGHTDNVPVVQPSPFHSNLELSTARALTVASQLVASGLPASRLVAAGYAEHEPVRENTSEAGRHENRRIEIVLMPKVTELPGGMVDAGAGDAAKK